jgi:chromate reductase
MRIVGIPGSLRRGSFNRQLLAAATELTPPGVSLEIVSLEGIPLFNADLEAELSLQEPLVGFRTAISEADAVLIATPEYNASIPGTLANALDWASRPARRAPLTKKPVGILSASPGALGGARAQEHLKLILMAITAQVMPHPGFVMGRAADKFKDGELVDDRTRDHLRRYVAELAEWAERVALQPAAV